MRNIPKYPGGCEISRGCKISRGCEISQGMRNIPGMQNIPGDTKYPGPDISIKSVMTLVVRNNPMDATYIGGCGISRGGCKMKG